MMNQPMGRRDEEFNGGFNGAEAQQPTQAVQPADQPQVDIPDQMSKMADTMAEMAAIMKQMADMMSKTQQGV